VLLVFTGIDTKESDVPSAKTGRHDNAHFVLTDFAGSQQNRDNGIRNLLLRQMIRAKRAGTWFRLPRMQRMLYSLAMRLEVKLKSPELLKALVSVLKRLRDTCDPVGAAILRAVQLAWTFSEAAVRWGNAGARTWRNDQNYIRFLASFLVSRGEF
jgi:hypothetical protein